MAWSNPLPPRHSASPESRCLAQQVVSATCEMNVPVGPGYGAEQGLPSIRLKHLSHTPPGVTIPGSTFSTARP